MSFLDGPAQFWSEWGLRIYVLCSLSANVLLSLLSWTRRRSAPGWRAVLLGAVARLLWLAYQGAEIAATGALGSLSLCGSDASPEEKQLIAFWAPFLLLHLGGPDTMTAYALEDNAMSLRKFAEMWFHVLGASYALYKYIFGVRRWTLLATASAIMFVVGTARYVEKWYALRRSNLGNMKDDGDDSSKKEEEEREPAPAAWSSSSKLNNEEALLLAQDLFHVCRRAIVDSSVVPDSEKQRASDRIFQLEWKSMCKVVEMELSLMYEALYTKAIVLHTRPVPAFLIRLLSPLATAAAVLLFNQYYAGISDSRRTITTIRGSFVKITYLLLGAALALDVVWLLRALGSTWTYAALKARRRPAWWARWLRHRLLRSGRWHRLHRAVVALDPMSWLFCSDPLSHRTWSGTIGRYNLLHECCVAAARAHRHGCRPWWRSWLEKMCELEERPYLSYLPQDAKKLLMERVRLILASTRNKSEPAGYVDGSGKPYYYTMAAIRTRWGHRAVDGAKKLLFEGDGVRRKELPLFAREFEEDVLAWHIATCVFLSVVPAGSSSAQVKAIEAMSEYLMFLVAVRRQMLPGLVLHSLFEASLKTLGEIWDEAEEARRVRNETSTTGSSSAAALLWSSPKDKLADILLKKKRNEREWFEGDGGRLLVYDASVLADIMIDRSRTQQRVPQLLDFVFNVWVDKLLYAAVRCSRENHAKQLSRGGELTTVLWIIAQHAGLFRIGERKPDYKEREEEKKAEETSGTPASPMPWPAGFITWY